VTFFNLQNIEIVYIAIFYCMLSVFIYFKLRKPLSTTLGPKEKTKQVMVLMICLLLFSSFVVVSGGVLAHQDTAWHQVTVTSNELIPGRLIIYSLFYPLYFIVGGAMWLYASTRFEARDFETKFKTSLFCIVISPFMFLPSQDPSMMVISTDIWSILFRSSYWALMAVWISSLLYLISRLVMMVLRFSKFA
jgi:Ammonia monooxygenase/methane monooxygenase, subunit C.